MHTTLDRPAGGANLAIAASLFVATLALYTLTASGGLHSNDELGILAVTESLVKRGSFDTNFASRLFFNRGDSIVLPGIDGNYYTVKGLPPSLVAAPAYALALVLPAGYDLTSITLLAGPLSMALAVALFYGLVINLGYSRGVAFVSALVFGLATPAWAYAETLFSENTASLALVLALFLLDAALRRDSWRLAALAGVTFGVAVASALPLGLLAPLVAGYALVRLLKQVGRRPGQALFHPTTIALTLGTTLAALGIGAYNSVRLGGMTMRLFDSPNYALDWHNLRLALPAYFVHPDRGVLAHVPLFLLLPWGMWLGWRQGRPEVFLGPLGLLLNALFYGSLNLWEGGVAWALRHHVPLMAWLVVALLPLFEEAARHHRRALLILLGALTTLSLYVQASGAFADWVPVVAALLGGFTPVGDLTAQALPYRVQDWVGFSQLSAAQAYPLDVWWTDRPAGAWLLAGSALLALGTGVVLLLHREASSERIGRVVRLAVGLLALGLLGWLTVLPGYARLEESLFGPALSYVQARAAPDDVLLLVAGEGVYEEFINEYRGQWRGYSARLHSFPLPPDGQGVVERATNAGAGVWMLTVGLAPAEPGNGVDRWLSEHAYKGPAAWQGEVLVTMFGTGPEPEREPVNGNWNDQLLLESAGFTVPSPAPGRLIAVDLTWRALAETETDYGFFVHLLSADGTLVAQTDYQPGGGYRPSTSWQKGERIRDKVSLWLPGDLRPGTYTLVVGVYDTASGERIPVIMQPSFEGDSLPLGEVAVPG